PRVAGENDVGAGVPAAITFRFGSVVALALKPLSITIVHSPGSGKFNAAVYSPRVAPGLTTAIATRPLAVVARTPGCNPASGVCPCWRIVKVRFKGFPATA